MTSTALAPLPPAKNLEYIFRASGMQQETMVDLLLAERQKSADDYSREQAEQDVYAYMDASEAQILKTLNDARNSPVVSRETQTAALKGLILDYQRGIKRPGLGAISVLKAIELLNKMTGYERPQEIKHTHEHSVNVFPVAEKPFKGELPPLKVCDLGDQSIAYNDADVIDVTPTEEPQESTELFP